MSIKYSFLRIYLFSDLRDNLENNINAIPYVNHTELNNRFIKLSCFNFWCESQFCTTPSFDDKLFTKLK